MRRIIAIIASFGLLLAACQSRAPLRQVTKGEELAYYNFSMPGSFEEGTYGLASLRVVSGAYRIDVQQGDNTLWWGQWGNTYDNVVIDVDTSQITERNENAFGVMCRVRGSVGQPRAVDPELAAIMDTTPTQESDPVGSEAEATGEPAAEAQVTAEAESVETEAIEIDAAADSTETPEASTPESSFGEGDGYLFLIQGTGSYAIMRARGRDVVPLVNWTTSEHIHVGPGQNHLRVICSGNYLAFYANDQFLADVTDDTYTRGQVGLVASAANRLGVRVEFDNLSISEARAG